jgi:hypothetical protein
VQWCLAKDKQNSYKGQEPDRTVSAEKIRQTRRKRTQVMSRELAPIDKAKFLAAKRAAEMVEDGMRVDWALARLPLGWCAALGIGRRWKR